MVIACISRSVTLRPFGVEVAVDLAAYLEACFGARRADKLDDNLMTDQRLPTPVHGDEGEHAMLRSCSTVCLAKAHRCRGCKSHPATLAPAGSARGGSGGDEWSEALREKVTSGDQRAIRAAAQASTNEASKGSNVRADPPAERGGRCRQASERDTPLTVSPG